MECPPEYCIITANTISLSFCKLISANLTAC